MNVVVDRHRFFSSDTIQKKYSSKMPFDKLMTAFDGHYISIFLITLQNFQIVLYFEFSVLNLVSRQFNSLQGLVNRRCKYHGLVENNFSISEFLTRNFYFRSFINLDIGRRIQIITTILLCGCFVAVVLLV